MAIVDVIVEFDGRAAIPVRAIPLLTDWIHMSPDQVVAALAWDQSFHWHFTGLTAMTIENDCIRPIPNTWWQSFPNRTLKAISDRIASSQISRETGYQEWRSQSLAALPPGTFVWKDEYEPLYYRYVAPRSAVSYEDGDELRPRYIQLQFDPFVPDQALCRIVMEGFDTTPAPADTDAGESSCMCTIESTSPADPDFGLLASRDELIAAFGAWGLKPAWFATPKGHQWLFKARKVKGRGQRGHVAPALYCPYEVMNGLVSQIRGRQRMSTEKGWKLLADNFPAVYDVYRIGDTRGEVTS